MLPLRIVESERDGFDEPIVEIWRDDEFIGMVFWDGDVAVAQIYPDDDGDVKDFEVREMMRILDMAERIVSPVADPDEFAELKADFASEPREEGGAWDGEDPTVAALMTEFDPQALHRTPDGEGFFSQEVGKAFIERCDELDLAVVEMEGFDLDGATLVPRPNLNMVIRVQGPSQWNVFRPAANGRALDTLTDWPTRDSLAVAFVIQQPDGETVVA
jgi:hypothetical protein